MTNNISEYERLTQELEFCRKSLKDGYHSKSTKEYLLREIRKLEQQLGIEHKPYNSEEFFKQ